MRFAELDVPPEVQEGIQAAGFTTATPIQEAALPVALRGKDVAGQAQTGTGKTAAFLISTFTRLLRHPPAGSREASPRALIIAPTRELAVQIDADARQLGRFTGLRTALVFGGVDYIKQRESLQGPLDLLIGTPGRLIDYLKQHAWSPARVEVLVLDEADRMFDMGFIADIRWILRRLPPPEARQSFLFSATLSFRVLELTYEFMNNPAQITVSPEQVTVERVEQVLYHAGRHEKFGLLLGLLAAEQGGRVLIFTNTRDEVHRLVERLERNGHAARALSGDVDQRKRLRTLEAFKDGSVRDPRGDRRGIAGASHSRRHPRLQLGPAAGPRGLRPPDRPDGAGRRVREGHQPGRRGERLLARGRRALHWPAHPRGVGGGRAVPARDQADRRGAPPVGRGPRGAPGRARGPRAAPGRPERPAPPAGPPPGRAPA